MAILSLTNEPSAIALAEQIRKGNLSPLEAVDAAITRIEKLDGDINAVVVRDFDRARATAKAMDGTKPTDAQPLFGVPMTVKESFNLEGHATTFGHAEFKDTKAARDAVVPTLLKNAGAIILGKTNVPPDLSDWQSTNPTYGQTVNPHDKGRSPGGSSGGSAAAVASGMVPIEFGTDIGGSVRVPAHFCGVWGHKSTWGLVSKRGHTHPRMAGQDAHDGVLSIAGPLARTAEDLDLLMRLTISVPVPRHPKPLKEMRFLAVMDGNACPVDASVAAPINAALSAIEATGAVVEHRSPLLPDLLAQHAAYLKMLAIAMARGMPGPDGQRANATDWFNLLDIQARCEYAWAELFTAYDFVLAPPAPVLAIAHTDVSVMDRIMPIAGGEFNFGDAVSWAGIATFPNLPSTVLPVGSSGNLPCGMQVIGPKWRDFDCIDAARQISGALGG